MRGSAKEAARRGARTTCICTYALLVAACSSGGGGGSGSPTAPSPSVSTVSASPTGGVVANGTQTSTISITVRTASGAPLVAQQVTLAATGTSHAIVQPAPTAVDGTTSGTISSTAAGAVVVTATVADTGGAIALTQQPTVTFVADLTGVVSSSLSTATASPTTGVVANGSDASTITITVVDGNGTPMSGQTVQLSSTGTSNTITQPGLTNGSGVTTGTITSTQAGTKVITATVNPGASQVVVAQTPSVTFVADPNSISASLSGVGAIPLAATANGTATSVLAIAVVDTGGNPVANQTAVISATGTGNIISQPGPTNAGGLTVGTIASTVAEAKTITVTVNPGPSQVVINQMPVVTFTVLDEPAPPESRGPTDASWTGDQGVAALVFMAQDVPIAARWASWSASRGWQLEPSPVAGYSPSLEGHEFAVLHAFALSDAGERHTAVIPR